MSRLKDMELDAARLIETAGLGTFGDGLPTLYAGSYPAGTPDAFIACRSSGDEPPRTYLAGTFAIWHEETATGLVRGERGPDAYAASRTRALAAWKAVQEARPKGYMRMLPEDAGPT